MTTPTKAGGSTTKATVTKRIDRFSQCRSLNSKMPSLGRLVVSVSVFAFLLMTYFSVINSNKNYSLWSSKDIDEGGEQEVSFGIKYPFRNNPNNTDFVIRISKRNSLLARPMDLLRRNVPLQTVYNETARTWEGSCSCLNPKATLTCCQRRVRRAHKMGCLLSQHIFDHYRMYITKSSDPPQYTYHMDGPPIMDYRDVYIFRDIYDSLVSGYLYHRMGRECDTNPYGGELRNMTKELGMPQVRDWARSISYELDPPNRNRSVCHYLNETSEEVGVRAYIDWIFRVHYSGPFAQWAMAQQLQEVQERTRVVCFDDLKSPDRDVQTIYYMMDFFFNGTDHEMWNGSMRPGHSDPKGHETSHDIEQRERIVDLIKTIDQKYYNGQIGWVHSTIPCQHRIDP